MRNYILGRVNCNKEKGIAFRIPQPETASPVFIKRQLKMFSTCPKVLFKKLNSNTVSCTGVNLNIQSND